MNAGGLDLAKLTEELEKQKKEREALMNTTERAIAVHELNRDRGEQSPSDEENPFELDTYVPDADESIPLDATGLNKAVLWSCKRDFFQPNVKLIKQYVFEDVVIEESKDCYVIYSPDVEKGVKTLFDNFDFEIDAFYQSKPESDNQDYLEEIFYQAVARGFRIFPSLLEHEQEAQRKAALRAMERYVEDANSESGLTYKSMTIFLNTWQFRSKKGMMLST